MSSSWLAGGRKKVAIQGELGSNSHRAALGVAGDAEATIVACGLSAEVFEAVVSGRVDAAVLPIENSLHGSVAEHYDLLLHHEVSVTGEYLLHVRHNVIAAPGVSLAEVKRVLSHPVALSQCRLWLRAHPEIEAVPFYDTAGSVKHVMEASLRDTAGIAPELAAGQYGAAMLVAGIEDHAENWTRFLVLERTQTPPQPMKPAEIGHPADRANKMSVAFSLEHRPGTLLQALEAFRQAQVNLTKIESRPVPGRPWEYVFFVDVRFEDAVQADAALAGLRACSQMVKELGRFRAA